MSFFNREIILKENMFLVTTFIAGIGSLALTVLWYFSCYVEGSSCFKNDHWNGTLIKSPQFELNFILIYYFFNSIVLVSLPFFLMFKKYKVHAFLSIILLISVIFSLFVRFGSTTVLFIDTIRHGIFAFLFGGLILVPMFLHHVYFNFKRGIKYLKNKSITNSVFEK